MTELSWFTTFKASEVPSTPSENGTPSNKNTFTLKGVLIDNTENKNSWKIEEEDFKHIAQDFIGKQVRTDHAEKVSNVLGKVISTEIDEPHTEAKSDWDPATPYPHIHFLAEVTSDDNSILIPVKMGYVSGVSPAVDAVTILCSECRQPMVHNGYQHVQTCKCEHPTKLLKNISARELSIVCSPAYAGTVMKPYGFAAAIDNKLNNIIGETMTSQDVDRITRLEASVSALIAAFKAAEEQEEEEKKVEEKKAEELKAEEEEAEKMVPVSKVAEEEEAEEKDEKEEKIEKLEAQIAQLASYIASKGKITPDTPEDEPAMTTHKIPKISNEPVKSDKPKAGAKSPFETPAQKPGKLKATAGKEQGIAQGFTGAVKSNDTDIKAVELKALDEVFGFAASRGVTPMHIDYNIKKLRV